MRADAPGPQSVRRGAGVWIANRIARSRDRRHDLTPPARVESDGLGSVRAGPSSRGRVVLLDHIQGHVDLDLLAGGLVNRRVVLHRLAVSQQQLGV